MEDLSLKLDKIATNLENLGHSRIAIEIDKVSNTIEKVAANRRMREFILEKARKWFPKEVNRTPEPVLFEIIDNFAQGISEAVSPDKGKIQPVEYSYEHIRNNPDGSKSLINNTERSFTDKLRNFVDMCVRNAPSLETVSDRDKEYLYTSIYKNLVRGEGFRKVKEQNLLDNNGKLKPNMTAYIMEGLLEEAGASKLQGVDSKALAKEIAQAMSLYSAKSPYVRTIIDLLTGTIVSEKNEDTESWVERVTNSETLKEALRESLKNIWKGPIDILIDPEHMDNTFERESFISLYRRSRSTSSRNDAVYKDKERMDSAEERLPIFPGKSSPWNKGFEIMLMKHDNGKYSIYEGWHRALAMYRKALNDKLGSFTISAYVADPKNIRVLISDMLSIIKDFFRKH